MIGAICANVLFGFINIVAARKRCELYHAQEREKEENRAWAEEIIKQRRADS
jgi:hypothetical protein